MECEECREDIDMPVILPSGKQGKKLRGIVCSKCASKSPAYCKKHQVPHSKLGDSTVCQYCVEEMVIKHKIKAEEMYLMFKAELPPKEVRKLNHWAREAALIAGNPIIICVLRAVVTKALDLGVNVDEIINRIIKAKSINIILSNLF